MSVAIMCVTSTLEYGDTGFKAQVVTSQSSPFNGASDFTEVCFHLSCLLPSASSRSVIYARQLVSQSVGAENFLPSSSSSDSLLENCSMSLLFPLHFHYQVPSCMKVARVEGKKEGGRKRKRGKSLSHAEQTAAAVVA